MIPSRTIDKVGITTLARIAKEYDRGAYYFISGNDIYELAVLAQRFNFKWDDPDEARDWENRINLMLSKVERM